VFVEDMMSDSPSDGGCTKFADYLTENYVTNDSRFPPKLGIKLLIIMAVKQFRAICGAFVC
jgi:hypothetical protein